jgi:catechol 2,3-dioxygenase-like lactoylglutathione lyase family enzyme
MKLGDLHHLTLSVRDLDASARFYRDLLGLREVAQFTFDDEGHQVYLGLPEGAGGRSVALRSSRPPSVGVTLVEVEPAVAANGVEAPLAPGTCMLAWELDAPDEVDALAAELAAAGIDALSGPTWAEVKGWGRVRGIAVRDPDGTLIELYATEAAT